MFDRAFGNVETDMETTIASQTPIGRIGVPEEITSAVFSSPAAAFATGQRHHRRRWIHGTIATLLCRNFRPSLESLKGKTCWETSQVLFRRIGVNLTMALPFNDSEGGTWTYSVLIGVTSAGTRQ
jgi:hypothetical protein